MAKGIYNTWDYAYGLNPAVQGPTVVASTPSTITLPYVAQLPIVDTLYQFVPNGPFLYQSEFGQNQTSLTNPVIQIGTITYTASALTTMAYGIGTKLQALGITEAITAAHVDGGGIVLITADTLAASGMDAGAFQASIPVLHSYADVIVIDWTGADPQRTAYQSATDGGFLVAIAADAGSADWNSITNKPATFPATVPVATATALATGRTFSLTGGATGTSAAFTGAANASIAVTLATPATAVRGGVLQQTHIAPLANPPLAADFNGLLTALQTAGILASS